MQAARLRLILATVLFAGWIGWLAYLAATTTKPIVLSRPQFLFSAVDVIAPVDEQDHRPVDKVTIQEVHWPPHGEEVLQGKTITVTNLAQCDGWEGPGQYILPLEKNGENYQVVPVPDSPGYPYPKIPPRRFRIYRLTSDTRSQLKSIIEAKPDVSVPLE
jgi:hypothetical protein